MTFQGGILQPYGHVNNSAAVGSGAVNRGFLPGETHMKQESSLPEYGIVVAQDVMVPMRDGVRLATDVYRPANPDGSPVEGEFPVILGRTFSCCSLGSWFNAFSASASDLRPELNNSKLPPSACPIQ